MHRTVPVPKDDCSFLLLSPAKHIVSLAGGTIKKNDGKKKKTYQVKLNFFSFLMRTPFCIICFNELCLMQFSPSCVHIHRHAKENKSFLFETIMRIKSPPTCAVLSRSSICKLTRGKSMDQKSKFLPKTIIATYQLCILREPLSFSELLFLHL